jgi:hypothetical protein
VHPNFGATFVLIYPKGSVKATDGFKIWSDGLILPLHTKYSS